MDNDKFKLYLAVMLKSLEFKDEPKKMAEFMIKNKIYFPSLKMEDLQGIIDYYDNPPAPTPAPDP